MSRRRWKSRKKRPTPWGPVLLGILLGGPIVAEVGARLLVGFQVLRVDAQTTAPLEATPAQAYELRFVTAQGQPYRNVPPLAELQAQRHPLLGYTLVPGQEGRFWRINDQGFREDEPVPLAKPEGEVRIFILGGSGAFGELSSSNGAVFSTGLEQKLNDRIAAQTQNPGRFQPVVLPYRADQVADALALPPQIPTGRYRVINAGVPGYGSGNTLGRLMYEIAAYNPDILVVMDGYGDLLLPGDQMAADIPQLDALLDREPDAHDRAPGDGVPGWKRGLGAVDQGIQARSEFIQVVQTYRQTQPEEKPPEPLSHINVMTPNPDAPLGSQLAADGAELQRRSDRYGRHLGQMVRWASANRKRLVVVLPPEITGRSPKNLTPSEQQILTLLGPDYTRKIPEGYGKLAQAADNAAALSSNATVLNFYAFNPDLKGEPVFQNATDLTDRAQAALADRLYNALVEELALNPQPFGSRP
jgi:hypothetical protein